MFLPSYSTLLLYPTFSFIYVTLFFLYFHFISASLFVQVLSTIAETGADLGPSSSTTLWLHILTYSSAPSPIQAAKQMKVKPSVGPLVIKGRLRLAGGVNSLLSVSNRPKLHRSPLPQSWRLYISWYEQPCCFFDRNLIRI